MKLQAQTQIKLRDLAEIGSLPESQCGRAFLKLLVPLLDSGVVCWQRCGVGRRLVVNDADTLRDFYRQRFPNAALPSGAGSRVASVGRFRDTKALTNSEGEIISLRVWQNEALLKNGKPFDAAPLTVAHGVFSFLFTRNCPYALVGSVQRIPSSVCCICRTTTPLACPNFSGCTHAWENESPSICRATWKRDSLGSQTQNWSQEPTAKPCLRNCVARN
ncbi:MAG: hypothetical protein DMG42_35870 [Acidobacteria bacterium]|nr:MAG: hypothetical protein DMG42_35870 [Acidobacteriota bacterium]